MRVAGKFSFNSGEEAILSRYPLLLSELEQTISRVDAASCKVKESKEKSMRGQLLYSPVRLNNEFKRLLRPLGWEPVRVQCDYPKEFYLPGYEASALRKGAFREMDFVKAKLGLEVQFGKYSFMVYNVSAKMTIFSNLGYIDAGIEVVPVKKLADEMSSGVSYFEQFVWDLQKRGVSDIDIPVLVIGIDAPSGISTTHP